MPSGRPSSSTARPVRARAAAWAEGNSGTSWSAPGEASTIRPCGPSTWMVSVPATTGNGPAGSWLLLISATTSWPPCRAVLSTPRVREAWSVPCSSIAPATRATARPSVVVMVTLARRLRRRHQRGTEKVTVRSSPVRPSPRCQPLPRPPGLPRPPRALSAVGGEAIASTTDRLQRAAAERVVDLAAQVPGVDLDHVRIHRGVGVPDVLEQRGLGHHLPGLAHQVLQQGELPRRQIDERIAAADLPGPGVEGEVPGPQLDGPRLRATAQQRPQPGGEHHVGEGLGEVVVRAQVQPVGLVVLPVLGGQDQDRDPVLLCP